jgi:hypothetical protein
LKGLSLRIVASFSSCALNLIGETTSDAPDDVPAAAHRIFVSSTRENANRGGLAGMDAWCNALASAAGLVRSYRAVISTSTVSVASRLTDLGPVYVVLPTGLLKVTESLSGLWGTSVEFLLNSIDYDENRTYVDPYLDSGVNGIVWTGSKADGTPVGNGHFCSNWTSTSAGLGANGVTGIKYDDWIELGSWDCSNTARVYCVSQ